MPLRWRTTRPFPRCRQTPRLTLIVPQLVRRAMRRARGVAKAEEVKEWARKRAAEREEQRAAAEAAAVETAKLNAELDKHRELSKKEKEAAREENERREVAAQPWQYRLVPSQRQHRAGGGSKAKENRGRPHSSPEPRERKKAAQRRSAPPRR